MSCCNMAKISPTENAVDAGRRQFDRQRDTVE